MKTIHILLASLSLLSFAACDLINPEEPVPAYVEIGAFTLTTDIAAEGTADHKITEAWVFINGEFLGTYDLPATVPVLTVGETVVRVEAGIRDNGIGSRPDIYPFYAPYSETVTLAANETVTIQPSVVYEDRTTFTFIEDFEDLRPRIFTTIVNGEQTIERTTADVFEGSFSGRITLTQDSPVVELSSGLTYADLQDEGPFVYLEVNYRSDVTVVWGIVGEPDPIAGLQGFYDPGFLAKDEWNKIYFNISQLIFDAQLSEYRIGFQAVLLDNEVEEATILLDNIKLVHF